MLLKLLENNIVDLVFSHQLTGETLTATGSIHPSVSPIEVKQDPNSDALIYWDTGREKWSSIKQDTLISVEVVKSLPPIKNPSQ